MLILAQTLLLFAIATRVLCNERDDGVIEFVQDTNLPFRNPKLSWDTRVDDLLSRLTLSEIASQTTDYYKAPIPGISRLGIEPLEWHAECLHGIAQYNVTAFPQSIGLSSTFR